MDASRPPPSAGAGALAWTASTAYPEDEAATREKLELRLTHAPQYFYVAMARWAVGNEHWAVSIGSD